MGTATSTTENPLLDGNSLQVGQVSLPTYSDKHFKKIREHCGISEDFLATGFNFDDLKGGGGKGGNPLALTDNRLFVVKEINDTDHTTLIELAEAYADHIVQPEGSLLCKIFAHFHHPERNKNYLAMNNVLPPPSMDVGTTQIVDEGQKKSDLTVTTTTASQRRRSAFDLKGCADDKTLEIDGERVHEVHKRIWHLHLWCGSCCWSRERREYYQGKRHALEVAFHITKQQHEDLSRWLQRDIDFLVAHGLMDYSLMVSCQRLPLDEVSLEAVREAHQTSDALPFISQHEDSVQIVHLGIIDFLQNWTWLKNVAMCIKCLERNKATIPPAEYGERFVRHFLEKFQNDAEL